MKYFILAVSILSLSFGANLGISYGQQKQLDIDVQAHRKIAIQNGCGMYLPKTGAYVDIKAPDPLDIAEQTAATAVLPVPPHKQKTSAQKGR